MFNESPFNGDISEWNVSKVVYMDGMFYGSKFNGDISKWNVSKVKNMSQMFEGAKFAGNIDSWKVNIANITSFWERPFKNSALEKKGKLPKWYKK